MIVNGQGPIPFGEGFLKGMRLLPIEEALDEYCRRKQRGTILTGIYLFWAGGEIGEIERENRREREIEIEIEKRNRE
jgi:hypothetical protein